MSVGDIIKTVKITENGQSVSISPPSGALWKVYGDGFRVSLEINGVPFRGGKLSAEVVSGEYRSAPRAIFIDDTDTLTFTGIDSNPGGSFYAVLAGDNTTGNPAETRWFTGSVPAESSTDITVPAGRWQVFTRFTGTLRLRVPVDEGTSGLINIETEYNPYKPEFSGGDTVTISNASRNASRDYTAGFVRLE